MDTIGDGSEFLYPCDAALPDFGFYVNGNLLTIPGALMVGFLSGNSKTSLSFLLPQYLPSHYPVGERERRSFMTTAANKKYR